VVYHKIKAECVAACLNGFVLLEEISKYTLFIRYTTRFESCNAGSRKLISNFHRHPIR
jgi:hypothetical protein